MTDAAFLARVATLLVERAAAATDPGADGRRVLDALVGLAGEAGPGELRARIAADERFAERLRSELIRAYAIPALARDLPDPAPRPGGAGSGCGS